MPVLCVGETEEERDAGDMERKLRHQVQEGLEKVQEDRLGDVVIAYEPIWAIGTGKVATPDQAQEAVGFVRALVADRSKEQPSARASSTGQRQRHQRAPSCSRCPTSTAPWSAARAWTRRSSRRSSPRPRMSLPAPACALVILDGWGLAPPGPATRSSWRTRRCSTPCGSATRTRS